jgi:hypothetical protein
MVVFSPNILPAAICIFLLSSAVFFILSFVLEPILIHDMGFYSPISLPLDHLLVVGSLPQLIHLNLFSLACIINIRHISSHKRTSGGFEPQWYITQHLVFTTRPLARCWKPTATYSRLLSSLCIN